jgi:hypothetical protein
VFDPDAPSTRRVLAEIEKKDVRNKLMKLAKWRARSQHEAEDLVQEALLVVCDPAKKPWREGVGFLSHMSRVMRDLWIEGWRSARALHEVIDPSLAHDDTTVDPVPLPDEALHYGRKLHWLRRLGERLMAVFGDDDPIATGSFRLTCEGIDDYEKQARLLQCTVDDIYDAQERLKDRGGRVREKYEKEEAARMADAREKAKKEKKARDRDRQQAEEDES